MKITISTAAPSQIETECLVVPVVDTAAEPKTSQSPATSPTCAQLQTGDKAVSEAAADLIASGEVTGKMLGTRLLDKPSGLKAKRLLLIGGGKAKSFSYELSKLAGAALESEIEKPEELRLCRAGSRHRRSRRGEVHRRRRLRRQLEPDYYQSDREDKKIDELVISAPATRRP